MFPRMGAGCQGWGWGQTRSSGEDPVSVAGFCSELRTVFHRHPNGMKCSWHAALRLEAENVLAMHFFADQLNGLFQRALFQETQGASAGDPGEQAGKIREMQPDQLF